MTPSISAAKLSPEDRASLTYRTVWRWHFYAGLFCIPFVSWLSITGSIYLFKPQIERWLDRPFDHLAMTGATVSPELQVRAALAAVPGSTLHYYQLAPSEQAAARVIVGKGIEEYRVYVDPGSAEVLKVTREDARPMNVVFRLHGQLLAGDIGSRIVELAASWAIVMILTGVYLWWPRQAQRLAGVLYIRLGKGRRIFWRDLHAVTGVWISAFALFLLLTGLPWAKGWGTYFKAARSLSGSRFVRQDWSVGRSSEISNRMALNANTMAGMSMEHANHMAMQRSPAPSQSYAPLNQLVPVVAALHMAQPVLLTPPLKPGGPWTARSDAGNRPLRSTVTLNAQGEVLRLESFAQRPLLDRIVGTGIAAHEGQLFGWVNQLLGLLTACGLVLLSVSAVVLWWRRRHVGVLGAPVPAGKMRFSFALAAAVVALAVYLPMMGISLLLVLTLERLVLRRMPKAQQWLGLRAA